MMRLNHPLKEEYLQLKSAISLRVWLFKQNQLPAIGAWLSRNKDTAVIVVGLIGVGFVAGQLASESEMMSRADAIHAASYADGQIAGCVATKEELVKQVTVQRCMGWLFNDDPTRVGKALQMGKLQ